MRDILIRIETQDYGAWLATHYDHVEDRRATGLPTAPSTRTSTVPTRPISTSASRAWTERWNVGLLPSFVLLPVWWVLVGRLLHREDEHWHVPAEDGEPAPLAGS
jgi:hypothetical protein